jgi:hypothetical protein
LPLLHRIYRPTPASLEGLRQKQNGGERRAEIVGDLDHQLETVRSGQPVVEMLGPIGFEVLTHDFDGMQQA